MQGLPSPHARLIVTCMTLQGQNILDALGHNRLVDHPISHTEFIFYCALFTSLGQVPNL